MTSDDASDLAKANREMNGARATLSYWEGEWEVAEAGGDHARMADLMSVLEQAEKNYWFWCERVRALGGVCQEYML